MIELRDYTKNKAITSFVTLEKKQEVNKFTPKTLDGKQHIQIIGLPTTSYDLRIFVTESGRDDIYISEKEATLLKVTLGSSIYYGRIITRGEAIRRTPKYYEMTLQLSAEAAP